MPDTRETGVRILAHAGFWSVCHFHLMCLLYSESQRGQQIASWLSSALRSCWSPSSSSFSSVSCHNPSSTCTASISGLHRARWRRLAYSSCRSAATSATCSSWSTALLTSSCIRRSVSSFDRRSSGRSAAAAARTVFPPQRLLHWQETTKTTNGVVVARALFCRN